MNLAEQSMGLGLRALTRLAGLDVVDRVGLRKPAERLIYQATRGGARAAGATGRTFAAASRLGRPARLKPASSSGLFDLTPTDEQQMLRDMVREFAADQVRPVAQQADTDCAAPDELLTQANELGLTMIGVPEELGGAVSESSTVTSVLIAEALAQGDMGIGTAVLAPAAVSTALSLWGDAEQQATYLPAFVGDDVPAAALAVLEARPLFDPFKLETVARRSAGGGFTLNGAKALVPRGEHAELFVVAARLEDGGPALFVVESKTKGLSTEAEPAMGIRASGTRRLLLDDVELPAGALLGEGDPAVYAECIQRARLAWCAMAVGTAQATLDYVIPYVKERVAFGEPIANRQAVAFGVSDIATELEGMRLLTWRAASLADRGRSFAREVAHARRLCASKGMEIGSQGVQLLGGHGFVKDHPVERFYRDLRATGVMEGALLV